MLEFAWSLRLRQVSSLSGVASLTQIATPPSQVPTKSQVLHHTSTPLHAPPPRAPLGPEPRSCPHVLRNTPSSAHSVRQLQQERFCGRSLCRSVA